MLYRGNLDYLSDSVIVWLCVWQENYDGVSRYQQFFEFNVFFVFITSLGLIVFSNVVSQVERAHNSLKETVCLFNLLFCLCIVLC